MEADVHSSSSFDPSTRASDALDTILDVTSEQTQEKEKQQSEKISIEEAREKEQLLQQESSRVQSRVLFITRDTHALEKDSALQKHFKSLEAVFDEVHVMVLTLDTHIKQDTQRLSEKVWVYTSATRFFVQQPFAAVANAKHQLQFTDGFRPDVVVALDPFESAVAGLFMARKFKRSFQVHITEDFFVPGYKESDPYGKWRLRFARYALKRTASVRVNTQLLKTKVEAHYKKIMDVSLLPQYFNIKEIVHRTEVPPSKKLYPQFAFALLFVGTLDQNSTLFRALDAVRALLRTPSIGMVVVGDGTAKEEFQQRAKLLGIDQQVIFVPGKKDLVPYMQSADVLVTTDTTSSSEKVVIQAAAAGLPLVIARTELREDLFTDGEDSFVCDPEDTIEFSQKLTKFLSMNALRKQFAKNARDIVLSRISESIEMYNAVYRDTIEQVLYLEVSKAAAKQTKKDVQHTKPKDKNAMYGIVMKMPEDS